MRYKTEAATAAATADYTWLATLDLRFAPGQARRRVKVKVKDDKLREADETFLLKLLDPSAGSAIADGTGVGTIRNDDGNGGGRR